MHNINLIGVHHGIADYSIIKSIAPVDIYHTPIDVIDNSNKKIFLQMEPDRINNCYHYLNLVKDKYDHILCYDPSQVQSDKTIKLICGGSWINKEDTANIDTSLKKFQISNLCGTKRMTFAHNLRILLYNNQLQLNDYPIVFFRTPLEGHGSGGYVLPDINNNPTISPKHSAKIDLFREFQFSIIIENSREKGYFSEKIIDCLITKTIPIYYGCINISDFFCTDGWIIIETDDIVNELSIKLKVLDTAYYERYKDVIEHNYKKAMNYNCVLTSSFKALNTIPYINVDISKCNYTY